MTDKTEIVEQKTELKTVENKGLVPIDISDMIAKVIDKGPEALAMMDGLLQLQERQEKKIALAEYNKAKAKSQKDMPSVKKMRKIMNKDNRTIRNLYASLDDARRACLPVICENGFSDSWKTESQQNGIMVIYTVRHDLGHEESTSMFCPMEQSNYMNAIQRSGSTITYGKRYTFCDFWGVILDEDDDGKTSSEEPNLKPKAGSGGFPHKEAPVNTNNLPMRPEAQKFIDDEVSKLDSPDGWGKLEIKIKAAGTNPNEVAYFFALKASWEQKIQNELNITNQL